MYEIFYIYFLLYFFHYHLSPLYPSPRNHYTVVHVNEYFLCFAQSFYPLTTPARVVSLLSMSLSLQCLLVPFVHQISHMSEITWYLSFSNWLISLSIMFSRSIHAVTKGKTSLFLKLSSIPLCKCPIGVLSTHLLMDTWAAFIFWQL